ncbi:hypothetical protein [Thalassobius sp. Cn5-15]|jgi:hypothetical protein|uniref:spike base protein, RCAP_Rcc01079 family n=1 Tax=Thalassobius sp. Cn5-15 TaxID=2917763 RepID=UPI001EF20B10|nr:hypothetical protein [Thalassobius sp. Cn5-15]MCG7495074.1 hypothetical protein [Thalassobius sp. Cn5-15]
MPAQNQFEGRSPTRAGGPVNLAQITPDDTTDLPVVSQWIYIGGAGTLRVTTLGGQTLTLPNLHVGWHLMELVRIHASGTTATDLIVGW